MNNNYTALYRKYRPKQFNDVIGQDVITQTLKNAIKENRIGHAYLFSGPRGTGKTSVAKIFATAINCANPQEAPCLKCHNCQSMLEGNNPDVIEMDAASNRGIDDIKNIIDKVKYSPIQSRYKVYIIDEVHMITKDAFNALLKTLEEPPEHTIFIFATTEPFKVIPTILSRCQRYNFAVISKKDIVLRLKQVIEMENNDETSHRQITYEDKALEIIADLANGGMRDALSILDQCLAYNNDEILVKDVNFIYGTMTTGGKLAIIQQIYNKDVRSLIKTINEIVSQGVDIKKLTVDLLDIYKESYTFFCCNNSDILQLLNEKEVNNLTEHYSLKELMKIMDILMDTLEKYEKSKNINEYFELCLLKLMGIKKGEIAINANEKPQEDIVVDINEDEQITSSNVINEDNYKKTKEIEAKTEIKTDEQTSVKQRVETKSLQKEVDNLYTSMDFFLSILVTANKEEKQSDISTIKNSLNVIDIVNMKYINVLKDAKVFASGKDVILLEVNYEALKNQINELEYNKEFYKYFKNVLNIDKMIYAITVNEGEELKQLFMDKMKAKTLPEAITVSKYKVEEINQKEVSLEDKLQEIFDDVVVIEENEDGFK